MKKVFECNLQLHAHNGSGFDPWIVLNNQPCIQEIVDIIKNGKGITEIKVLMHILEKKQTPQYLQLGYGLTHLNCSL